MSYTRSERVASKARCIRVASKARCIADACQRITDGAETNLADAVQRNYVRGQVHRIVDWTDDLYEIIREAQLDDVGQAEKGDKGT